MPTKYNSNSIYNKNNNYGGVQNQITTPGKGA